MIDHQSHFVRQSHILRKNVYEWDQMLRSSRGEDWPSMLGRLNAAMNQTTNIDQSIEDETKYLVYEPKKSTTNPQDIPFFLSVRLVDENHNEEETEQNDEAKEGGPNESSVANPVEFLTRYEQNAADLANEFEDNMVRF